MATPGVVHSFGENLYGKYKFRIGVNFWSSQNNISFSLKQLWFKGYKRFKIKKFDFWNLVGHN